MLKREISWKDFASGIQRRCAGFSASWTKTAYGPESMAQSAILVSAEPHAFNLFNSGTSQSKNPFSFLKIGLGLKNRLCPWLHIEHIFRSFFFFFLTCCWTETQESTQLQFAFISVTYIFFVRCVFGAKKGKKCSINKELTRQGNTGKEGTRFLY